VFDEFHDAASPSLLDGCVIDPTTLSHSNLLYESVGAAAAMKERVKSAKYRAMVERMWFHLSVFGIESWGAWGPAATRVLQRIVQHAAEAGGPGATNTMSTIGWCAPRIAEVGRQWVSVALRVEEVGMIRQAAVRR
jgi:hypothetical protein